MKDLKLHILSLKVYNCDICKEAFRTAEEKEKHKETKHFNCKKCLRSFGSTIAVELHSKFGHAPFKCELCPETFEKYSHMEEHRKSHSVGQPLMFMCRNCGAQFSTSDGVLCHQVLFPKCEKTNRMRKAKSKKDKEILTELEKIVSNSRIVYNIPADANILVV